MLGIEEGEFVSPVIVGRTDGATELLNGTEELGACEGEQVGFARVGLMVGTLDGLSDIVGLFVSPNFVGEAVGFAVDSLPEGYAVTGDFDVAGTDVASARLGALEGTKDGKKEPNPKLEFAIAASVGP